VSSILVGDLLQLIALGNTGAQSGDLCIALAELSMKARDLLIGRRRTRRYQNQ
jgi:hypothetical protein